MIIIIYHLRNKLTFNLKAQFLLNVGAERDRQAYIDSEILRQSQEVVVDTTFVATVAQRSKSRPDNRDRSNRIQIRKAQVDNRDRSNRKAQADNRDRSNRKAQADRRPHSSQR